MEYYWYRKYIIWTQYVHVPASFNFKGEDSTPELSHGRPVLPIMYQFYKWLCFIFFFKSYIYVLSLAVSAMFSAHSIHSFSCNRSLNNLMLTGEFSENSVSKPASENRFSSSELQFLLHNRLSHRKIFLVNLFASILTNLFHNLPISVLLLVWQEIQPISPCIPAFGENRCDFI